MNKNIKVSISPDWKDAQREKLLAEEKYELLIELEEIYDKIKKEHDNL
jgi:hypothetical protein